MLSLLDSTSTQQVRNGVVVVVVVGQHLHTAGRKWQRCCFVGVVVVGLSGTVLGHTNFDATNGQYVVSDRNLAGVILIRHQTPSNSEVKVCLLP